MVSEKSFFTVSPNDNTIATKQILLGRKTLLGNRIAGTPRVERETSGPLHEGASQF